MAFLKRIRPSDIIPLSLIIFCLLCFSVIVILWILPLVTTSPREKIQQELAEELGVEVSDYPYPYSFPAGYFDEVLESGIPIADVHKVVIGYSQVFWCGKTQELYYFLSTLQEDAVRMWIFYDREGKYKRLQVEDNDSGGLPKGDCQPGLLSE